MNTAFKCLAAATMLVWLAFLTCRIGQTRYAVEQACAYGRHADYRDPLPPRLPLPPSDTCALPMSIDSILIALNHRQLSQELLGAWLMQR